MGGTVALHARARRSRRPVRPDARRAGLATARPTTASPKRRGRARVLGAALRVNLGAARRRAVGSTTRRRSTRRPLRARAPAARRRHPLLGRSPSRSRQRQPAAAPAPSSERPAPLRRRPSEPWRPDWVCYYFINDGAAPSFVVDVSDVYEIKRRALACHRIAVRAGRRRGRGDAPDLAAVRAAGREPRRAVRRAGRRPLRRRLRRARAGACAASEPARERRPRERSASSVTHRSAAAASSPRELATSLARRGHEVHVLSSDIPFRLREQMRTGRVPSRRHAGLSAVPRAAIRAVAVDQASCRWRARTRLDIVHAHYAVPHAAGAYLARQILASQRRARCPRW